VYISLIIPSGGIGQRMNSDIPKQYLEIDNEPIIIKTLKNFENFDEIKNIFIPINENWIDFVKNKANFFNIKKNLIFVSAGNTRAESILNAIKDERINSSDFVLVHDAVRMLVKNDLVQRIIKELKYYDIVIPAIKITDTIKEIKDNFVVKTLNRENIYKIQTPQGVKLSIYQDILNKINFSDPRYSDDASIFENFGYKVKVIEGDNLNVKITNTFDFEFVKYIINKNNQG
jgi:2-C-methyl-D-erythritol 4-phosphate cytidylyltransferase